MTERERLIELLMQGDIAAAKQGVFNCCMCRREAETIADYLLENGVIVPSVQVGATVYYTDSYRHLIKPLEIFGFDCTKRICKYYCSGGDYTPAWFNPAEIGKTVFLTREEAENALKERDENA